MPRRDKVIEPRLRFGTVLFRGAMFGLLALVPTALVALLVDGRQDRLTFLAVTAGLSFVTAACLLPFGAFYWWCSRGDVRRWRDWRTVTGLYGPVAVYAAVFSRLGTMAVVLGCGALLLYAVADEL